MLYNSGWWWLGYDGKGWAQLEGASRGMAHGYGMSVGVGVRFWAGIGGMGLRIVPVLVVPEVNATGTGMHLALPFLKTGMMIGAHLYMPWLVFCKHNASVCMEVREAQGTHNCASPNRQIGVVKQPMVCAIGC